MRFKILDTDFLADAHHTILKISTETMYGDTSYLYPGTPGSYAPAAIPGYDVKATMLDTLNFTSATTGSEILYNGSLAFTYSFTTHEYSYTNTAFNPRTFTVAIYQPDASTVEEIITGKDNGVIIESVGNYFRKLP